MITMEWCLQNLNIIDEELNDFIVNKEGLVTVYSTVTTFLKKFGGMSTSYDELKAADESGFYFAFLRGLKQKVYSTNCGL